MSLQNRWHHRRVADTASRACYICYKPSSSVLITPDNKDFFYVCPAHLRDRHFCSPVADPVEDVRKRHEEMMAREIEAVKREYEEKQAKKAADELKSTEDKDKEKEKEKERKDKIHSVKTSTTAGDDATVTETKTDDGSPRIFALHKNFYQMRVDRLRNIEAARKSGERLKDPSLFPTAPSSGL